MLFAKQWQRITLSLILSMLILKIRVLKSIIHLKFG